MKIAALIMVRDEADSIAKTIESCSRLTGVILFDTGSVDDTIRIATETCSKMRLPLHVKQSTFVDFATSRNESLDFADTFTQYDGVLLLDANDIVDGYIIGVVYPTDDDTSDCDLLSFPRWNDAYYVLTKHQRDAENVTSFYNLRLVRLRAGCRFRGVVHEYLVANNTSKLGELDTIVITQDRRIGAEKSRKRWVTDRVLLEREHEREPTDTRTLYYLAQTYDCLGETELALKTYAKRAVAVGGFDEERWQSMLRCGELETNDTEAIMWFTKCAMHKNHCRQHVRAEPLVNLAKRYQSMGLYELAYSNALLACELQYPSDAILFVDDRVYSYTRWQTLGIVAFYAAVYATARDDIQTYKDRFKRGYDACIKVYDKKNLEWYIAFNNEDETHRIAFNNEDEMHRC